jgi:hypothetical protein
MRNEQHKHKFLQWVELTLRGLTQEDEGSSNESAWFTM